MKISIIIPVYNGEKYIENCIDSLNDFNGEIIVVNDGSTDRTKEILKRYSNIKVYSIPNQGLGHARNYGISKSTGDYIMFIDADDYVKSNFCEIMDNLKFFGEDVIYFNESINQNISKDELLRYVSGMYDICLAGAYCKLYRKKFLISKDIKFQEDLVNGEDMLFNIKCLSLLDNFRIVNMSFYMYRVAINSMSRSFDEKIFVSDQMFHEYLYLIMDEADFLSNTKDEVTDFLKFSAIVTVMDRVSYLRDYSFFKKKLNFIKYYPYKEVLLSKRYYKSFKWKFFIFLFRFHWYFMIYLCLRISHFTKRKEKYVLI